MKQQQALTLIELSIALVIIGLIVGGLLVGKDLIWAAQARSQISQIQSYQTAVNTFKLKYNCLPGDCANAAQFGFPARGTGAARGDGNGILEGIGGLGVQGVYSNTGELLTFWVDLSMAKLIPETFSIATPTVNYSPTLTSSPNLSAFMPKGKYSDKLYVYVYSGTTNCCPTWYSDGKNYFGLSALYQLTHGGNAIRVADALAIDTKLDDGMPQTGKVIAGAIHGYFYWAGNNGGSNENSLNGPSAGSWNQGWTQYACMDNGWNPAVPMKYTMSNADLPYCALSFPMQ